MTQEELKQEVDSSLKSIQFKRARVLFKSLIDLIFARPIPVFLEYNGLISQENSYAAVLVIGDIYVINSLQAGDNFANVGYVSEGTPFEATGTTPTVWTNGTQVLSITESQPSIVIFNNEIEEDIEWVRDEAGVSKSTGYSFDEDLTQFFIGANKVEASDRFQMLVDNGNIKIKTERLVEDAYELSDNCLVKVPFTIRVKIVTEE